MGRTLPVCLTALLCLECGCGGASATRHARYQAHWDRLCALARPAQPAPAALSALPALTAEQTAALHAVAENARSSVVLVRTANRGVPAAGPYRAMAQPASRRSGGTGVVIDPRGLILTSAHVVRDAEDISVVLPDGARAAVARIFVDARFDLAVLRVRAAGLRPLAICESRPGCGRPVVALGWVDSEVVADGRPGRVADASTSLQYALDPTRLRCYDDLIESTAQIAPGFSGGPLLDAGGNLVGVNVAISGSSAARRAYAIPFNAQVRKVVSRLAGQARGG